MKIKRKLGWNRKGVILTDETKLKMSISQRKWHQEHTHPLKDKQHTPETKLRMSQAQQGDRNANWQGGITDIIRSLRRTYATQEWRKSVFKRDGYACKECGATNNLQAHHIKPVHTHPHLIQDLPNGLTLCKPCHKKLHGYSYG